MRRVVHSISIVALSAFIAATGYAQESQTEWQDHQGMLETRIIAGSAGVAEGFEQQLGLDQEGKALLAWEATLKDGWKTYWRSPGEAGLPVRVFNGDTEIDILYPFPERFELFGLETYGYSKQVTIPFEVPKKTGEYLLKADFMVCKDICVPFNATYEIFVDPSASGTIVTDTRIKGALAEVPHRFGADNSDLAITSVSYSGKPGHQNLIVEAKAKQPLSKSDLLAELDNATQFRAPKMRMLADGKSFRYILPVVSSDKNLDLSGKRVRLTLSDGRGRAIDRFFDLPSR